MRHLVLVVHHSLLGRELSVGERCINVVASAWLSKVYHRDTFSCLHKSHASQLGKRRTETVASHFKGICWVKFLKASDLGVETIPDGVHCFVEASMHLAAALGPDGVVSLCGIEVCDPVVDRVGALISNVDRLV